MGFVMLPHPLTNFELEKYYQNEPGFNGVYSRNNLLKTIKDGAYVINLGLFCHRSETVYFNSFGVEHVPEQIKEFVGNKNIKKHLSRTSKQLGNVWVLSHWIHSLILC